MPLPSSKKTVGLGRAIANRRAKDALTRNTSDFHTTDISRGAGGKGAALNSVTQQGDLEDFLSTAQLADADFTAERRNVTVVAAPGSTAAGGKAARHNPFLLSSEQEREALARQEGERKSLRVPRRPQWNASTTPGELSRLEKDSFLNWRRSLAELTDHKNFMLTPFERNIEVWRQLWRVVERSHLVVQIVDARNPLKFRCVDLEDYVTSVPARVGGGAPEQQEDDEDDEDVYSSDEDDDESEAGQAEHAGASTAKGPRRNLLLINKADLLDEQQRQQWARYFKEHGIAFAFFSAADAAALQAERAAEEARLAAEEDSDDEEDDDDDEAERVDPRTVEDAITEAELAKAMKRAAIVEKARANVAQDGDASAGPSSTAPIDLDADPTRVLNVFELEELFLRSAPSLSHFAAEDGSLPPQLRVGLVGYPNVGKSSTINALLGAKKVSVSSTPGKTKHFQTLHLSDQIQLCDCPGLVFPQFATSAAELVCDGILPIDQMREYSGPGALVQARIPRDILEGEYGIRLEDVEEGISGPTGLELLTAYAVARGYTRQGQGNPDESRSARYVLKDYVNARLLFCHPPPGIDADDFNEGQRQAWRERLQGRRYAPELGGGGPAQEDDADYHGSGAIRQGAITSRAKPGSKSRAIDASFFSTQGAGQVLRRAPTAPTQGRLAPDGTPLDARKVRMLELMEASGGKKHFNKGKKRGKQRSGQGYD